MHLKLNSGIISPWPTHDPPPWKTLPLSPLAVEPLGLKNDRNSPQQHGLLNGWRLLVLKPNVCFCIDHRNPRGSSFSNRWLLLHVMNSVRYVSRITATRAASPSSRLGLRKEYTTACPKMQAIPSSVTVSFPFTIFTSYVRPSFLKVSSFLLPLERH